MLKQMGTAFRITLFFTVVTGLVYPSVITALCQLILPHQANGSLVEFKGRVVGSALIGQNFSKPEYFHPRPSAAGKDGYDATSSQGSNYGPTSQKLVDRVKASVVQFHRENPRFTGLIPSDIVTASGSGLDPDISPAAAQAQASRIAMARGISPDQVLQIIREHREGRSLWILEEPRVNVLKLNLALDGQYPTK